MTFEQMPRALAEQNLNVRGRMTDSKPLPKSELPPPREYWRLLEPKVDTVQVGDEYRGHNQSWYPVPDSAIGDTVSGNSVIRRHVGPPPTCATCPSHTKRSKHNVTDDRELYCERFLIPRRKVDYCSEHPQAQKANRG